MAATMEDSTDPARQMAMKIFERMLTIWDDSNAPRSTFAEVTIQGGAGLLLSAAGQDAAVEFLRGLADELEAGEVVEESVQ